MRPDFRPARRSTGRAEATPAQPGTVFRSASSVRRLHRARTLGSRRPNTRPSPSRESTTKPAPPRRPARPSRRLGARPPCRARTSVRSVRDIHLPHHAHPPFDAHMIRREGFDERGVFVGGVANALGDPTTTFESASWGRSGRLHVLDTGLVGSEVNDINARGKKRRMRRGPGLRITQLRKHVRLTGAFAPSKPAIPEPGGRAFRAAARSCRGCGSASSRYASRTRSSGKVRAIGISRLPAATSPAISASSGRRAPEACAGKVHRHEAPKRDRRRDTQGRRFPRGSGPACQAREHQLKMRR